MTLNLTLKTVVLLVLNPLISSPRFCLSPSFHPHGLLHRSLMPAVGQRPSRQLMLARHTPTSLVNSTLCGWRI